MTRARTVADQPGAASANGDFLADLLSTESATMETAATRYEDFHKTRFDYVVEKCREVCPDSSAHVLDVGRSFLTLRLLAHYDHVSTLGFPLGPHSFRGIDLPGGGRKPLRAHITYDLNDAQTLAPIESDELFDLVVFAEVIEHLHTAPELTLFVLKRLMRPDGYMVIQTPNAAALNKRLMLLAGRNPYEQIRIDIGNPGHFREYTKSELIIHAGKTGLDVVSHEFRDYFGWPKHFASPFTHAMFKAIVAMVPVFARGQTLVLRNRPSVTSILAVDDE